MYLCSNWVRTRVARVISVVRSGSAAGPLKSGQDVGLGFGGVAHGLLVGCPHLVREAVSASAACRRRAPRSTLELQDGLGGDPVAGADLDVGDLAGLDELHQGRAGQPQHCGGLGGGEQFLDRHNAIVAYRPYSAQYA